MTEHALFTPFTAGKIDLKNRIVMAPLTRNRADTRTTSSATCMSNTTASAPVPG